LFKLPKCFFVNWVKFVVQESLGGKNMSKGLKVRIFPSMWMGLFLAMGGVPSASAQEAAPTPSLDSASSVGTLTAPVSLGTRFYGATGEALHRVGGDGELQWEQPLPGAASSLESEPDGSILVSGVSQGVGLLAFSKGDWKEIWNWQALGFGPGDIASAVAADKDPNGRVSLVLAAQPGKNRIFLAEARSHQVKVRWEFRTDLPPRRAGVCPDTKNFWVLSAEPAEGGAWRLDEVDFKNEKVVWSLDITAATMRPYDVLWTPEGKILISDPSTASVAAFDRKQTRLWQSAPLGAAPVSFLPMSLTGRQAGAGILVGYSGGPEGSPHRVVSLDRETGDETGSLETLLLKGQASGLPVYTALASVPVPGGKSKRRPSAVRRQLPAKK
jgi:hypothetical protein